MTSDQWRMIQQENAMKKQIFTTLMIGYQENSLQCEIRFRCEKNSSGKLNKVVEKGKLEGMNVFGRGSLIGLKFLRYYEFFLINS